MNSPEQPGLKWIKALRSYGTGACVELARSGEDILLRHSQSPHVLLVYSTAEIDAFLDAAKKGEFDHLVTGG